MHPKRRPQVNLLNEHRCKTPQYNYGKIKAKGMHNIFNKIITENFPNLEKTMPIQA
jgi:hypothetical protein